MFAVALDGSFLPIQLIYCRKSPAVKNDNEVTSLEPIKFPLQVMKPLGAQWIMELHVHMLAKLEVIKSGF